MLIAVVILGILSTATLVAGTNSQQKARITAAMTAFSDYEHAFIIAYSDHPGIVSARKKAWPEDGSGDMYTSEKGLRPIVDGMNISLNSNIKLDWDPTLKVYRSLEKDPWGGYYVLME